MANAELRTRDLRALALEPAASRLLTAQYERGTLSARGRDRVLRVARTIADLAAEDPTAPASVEHLAGALHLHRRPEVD